jgi:hypothetical protein
MCPHRHRKACGRAAFQVWQDQTRLDRRCRGECPVSAPLRPLSWSAGRKRRARGFDRAEQRGAKSGNARRRYHRRLRWPAGLKKAVPMDFLILPSCGMVTFTALSSNYFTQMVHKYCTKKMGLSIPNFQKPILPSATHIFLPLNHIDNQTQARPI